MSLTPAQLAEVNRTWVLAAGQFDQTGRALYATLFSEQPQYQELFSHFKGKSREEYEKEDYLKFHYTRVLKQFTSLIGVLDKPEEMQALMEGVVTRHRKYQVDTLVHYEHLVHAVVSTLKNELGPEFNEESLAAWGKVGALIIGAVKSLL